VRGDTYSWNSCPLDTIDQPINNPPAMPSTVPTLDPEWIEKVEPILPKLPSGSVQDIRGLMEKLDAVKLASLNETMPELKEGLDISNVMVPMRDGVEREMRIFKPQGGSAACPVYMR
jgi:hypothetical protein